MRRRDVVLGSAAAAVLAAARARAQPASRTYRVGVLLSASGLAGEPYVAALRASLARQGFSEGTNLQLHIQAGDGQWADEQRLAALRLDAWFVSTTSLALQLVRVAPSTPIVFAWVADPVRAGLVTSVARPGTNVTGVTNRFFELARKRVELALELLPTAKRIAVAAVVFDAYAREALAYSREAAQSLGSDVIPIEALYSWGEAVDRALAEKAAAMTLTTPFAAFGLQSLAADLVRRSAERRMPVIYADAESVQAGGLLSYGTSLIGDVRQAADMLVQILRGARPADMAVQSAARFELALNLGAARAIGMEFPTSILLRANRVIE